MYQITFTATTWDELRERVQEAARRLGESAIPAQAEAQMRRQTEEQPRLPDDVPRPTSVAWSEFYEARTPKQKRVLDAYERAGGSLTWAALLDKVEMEPAHVAPLLSSLNRAAKTRFGDYLILIEERLRQPDGTLAYGHSLNPRIYDNQR